MVTRRYWIHGRVQGVGYRRFASEIAQELKLRGWVRNLRDGRVEVLAIGSSQRLEAFEKCLAQGPARAEVLKIEHREESSAQEFNAFSIAEDGI